jgi:hypothetical protein
MTILSSGVAMALSLDLASRRVQDTYL